jgi:hypothetical protein
MKLTLRGASPTLSLKAGLGTVERVKKGEFPMTNKANNAYEVLSPWAEADPIPFRGISPRLEGLASKKIGLFRNSKRAALPLLNVVGRRLKEKFPTAELTEFANLRPNEVIIEQDAKEEFEDWLKGVDAVVAAFGD